MPGNNFPCSIAENGDKICVVMNTAANAISPETVARIREQALDMGLSADEYIVSFLPDKKTPELQTVWEEFVSDMEDFSEETIETASYDGTYSRSDIYFDHD